MSYGFNAWSDDGLARIARLIRDPAFLEQLKIADTAEKLYQVIRTEDERHP